MILDSERERYARYLCSREWAELRNVVLKRCGGICERCFEHPVSHVHHLTYIRKYAELPEDLEGLCVPCHEFTHGKRDVDPITQLPPWLFGLEITDVYLAGKIRENCWRDEVLGTVKYHSNWSIGDEPDSEWFLAGGCPIPGSIWALDYRGPFFMDDAGGHGGPYGPHAYGGCYPEDEDSDDPVYTVDYGLIRRKSLGSLDLTDLVFAWIDRLDIPGTIAEIAFAYGRRIQTGQYPVIVIATPPGFPCDDMPFVLGMADYRIIAEPSPGAAWKHLWTSPDVRRRRNGVRAAKGVLVQ